MSATPALDAAERAGPSRELLLSTIFLLKRLGGAAKDNVTRKTDYVVVGADPGSKLARARELGITTLNEEEFLNILNREKP